MSLPAVMRTVEDINTTQTQTAITAPMVLRQVCKYFDVDDELLKSGQRSRNIAQPRQIAMYLIQTRVGTSLEDIGKLFHRDHETVHHAVKKVEGDLARGIVLSKRRLRRSPPIWSTSDAHRASRSRANENLQPLGKRLGIHTSALPGRSGTSKDKEQINNDPGIT